MPVAAQEYLLNMMKSNRREILSLKPLYICTCRQLGPRDSLLYQAVGGRAAVAQYDWQEGYVGVLDGGGGGVLFVESASAAMRAILAHTSLAAIRAATTPTSASTGTSLSTWPWIPFELVRRHKMNHRYSEDLALLVQFRGGGHGQVPLSTGTHTVLAEVGVVTAV